MRPTTLACGAALAVALIAPACGDYAGSELEIIDLGAPADLRTYRIYVRFTRPSDQLLAISGNLFVGPLAFSTNIGLVNSGGPLEGTKAEDFARQPITGAWDSFVTIDADGLAGNDTDYRPGFLGGDGTSAVITGAAWSQAENGGWFDSNPGTPAIAGDDLRILIAQFTVKKDLDGSTTLSLSGSVDWLPSPELVASEPLVVSTDPDLGACCLPEGLCLDLLVEACIAAGGLSDGMGSRCAGTACFGACCFADGTCVEMGETGCLQQAGTFTADTTCLPLVCGTACCLPDGACIEVGDDDCRAAAGVSQGPGASCVDAQCSGACCSPDGTCIETGAADCVSAAGIFQGEGSACGSLVCGSACCFADGTCIEVTAADCAAGGGVAQDDGVACDDGVCLGACCQRDGICTSDSETTCIGGGGVFSGIGASCDGACISACCFDDGSCTSLAAANCNEQGGRYQGPDVACADASCHGTCCVPEGRCLDGLTSGTCADAGGVYGGDDTQCTGAPCPGACCLPEGPCTIVTAAVCGQSGGNFSGPMSACGGTCVGACCIGSADCTQLDGPTCLTTGGRFFGAGSVCSDIDCDALVVGEIYTIDAGAPPGYTTYRVRLVAPNGPQLAAFGAGLGQPVYFATNRGLLNTEGPLAGLKEEDFARSPLTATWDSFVTIGAGGAEGNDTNYAPGFLGSDGVNAVIVGQSWSEPPEAGGSWFDTVPGTAVVPDAFDRILIAQLTVENEPDGTSGVVFGGTAFLQFGPGATTLEYGAVTGGTVTGACCLPAGGCVAVDGPACTRQGGTFSGAFVACDSGPCPCGADLNTDFVVGFKDLLQLLSSWGSCPGCAADLNEDGVVSVLDLSIVLAGWGPCP